MGAGEFTGTGRIFDIQRFCLHDGPGIRTTLFLKGCPLRCLWCHNPEGISGERHLSFDEGKCIGCGACALLCPSVHRISGKHLLCRDACSLKGACVEACPSRALEIVGRDITVEEAAAELLKDKPYYEESGGGVTISGGEPVMQGEFLCALALRLKGEGIRVALETSGFGDYGVYENLLSLADLFLYDYKESDPERHRQYTGADNQIILDNLKRLHDAGASILLRCPIIPGVNDREDHFKGIAALARKHPNLLGVEVLPYHKLGVSKTGRLGLQAQREYVPLPADVTGTWPERIRQYGVKVVNR
jgi:pyruvate formate lyase activating enzyme